MINVTAKDFYGPFDLLLDLIAKSKIDIYDIEISKITNDYIEAINSLELDANEMSNFILMASQLLYIKTSSLIKDTFPIDEEEGQIISKDELIRRLLEYRKFKSIIPLLLEFKSSGEKKYYKLQEDLSTYVIEEDLSFDLNKIYEAINDLINKNKKVDRFKVDRVMNISEYSLEEYTVNIKLRLIEKNLLSITKMLNKVKSKSEAIIIFLSILELSKRKDLFIIQDSDTLEIQVKANEVEDGQERD